MKRPWGLLTCLALFSATLAAQTPPSSAAPNGGPQALPRPAAVEGRPIETRPPEKSDNKPAFPEQTRAPYHASAPFKVTTLIDNLPAPWSLAFLPDGKILAHRTAARQHPHSGYQGRALGARGRCGRRWRRPAQRTSACSTWCSTRTLPPTTRSSSPSSISSTGTQQQYVCRAGPARRSEVCLDRRESHLSSPAGHAVQKARRQDRRPHRDRARRQSVRDHRRPVGFAALGRRAAAGHRSRQDHSHHARRRARARQSVPRQAGRSARDLGLRHCAARKAWRSIREPGVCGKPSTVRAAATS